MTVRDPEWEARVREGFAAQSEQREELKTTGQRIHICLVKHVDMFRDT